MHVNRSTWCYTRQLSMTLQPACRFENWEQENLEKEFIYHSVISLHETTCTFYMIKAIDIYTAGVKSVTCTINYEIISCEPK